MLVVSARAGQPPEAADLPAEVKPVQGIAMPVPKEIFRTLDQISGANWNAARRPEIAHWKSHGDETQVAALLGIVLAEGFIAMEAQDTNGVKEIGASVLKLAQGLGVKGPVLARSRSIIDHAEANEWDAARAEWDAVLSDLERGLITLRSENLAQLVSAFGWLRGTEALSSVFLQNYSSERAQLLRQPALVDYLDKQLPATDGKIHAGAIVRQLREGLPKVRELTGKTEMSREDASQLHDRCNKLVRLAASRPPSR